jgi:hypothetical protein
MEKNNINELYEETMESISILEDACMEMSKDDDSIEFLNQSFEDSREALKQVVMEVTGFCPCCNEQAELTPEENFADEVMSVGVEMDTEDDESRIRLNLYSPHGLQTTTPWFDCVKEEEADGSVSHELSAALSEALRELADQVERRKGGN